MHTQNTTCNKKKKTKGGARKKSYLDTRVPSLPTSKSKNKRVSGTLVQYRLRVKKK